jgi:hypothetical protein
VCPHSVAAPQESELSFTNGLRRVTVSEQGAMECHREVPTHLVVDVSQAGHDARHTGREEWPRQRHRAFET